MDDSDSTPIYVTPVTYPTLVSITETIKHEVELGLTAEQLYELDKAYAEGNLDETLSEYIVHDNSVVSTVWSEGTIFNKKSELQKLKEDKPF